MYIIKRIHPYGPDLRPAQGFSKVPCAVCRKAILPTKWFYFVGQPIENSKYTRNNTNVCSKRCAEMNLFQRL